MPKTKKTPKKAPVEEVSPNKFGVTSSPGSEDEIIGEPEEFLDEDKPHERLPVKIRIGESIAEAEENKEIPEDQDEVAPWEEGFAEGAEHEGEGAVCAHCRKVLGDRDAEIVEREYEDEIFFFCSEKCAKKGPARE